MITATMLNSKSSKPYVQHGKLCADLNVDAVVVIRFDLATRPTRRS